MPNKKLFMTVLVLLAFASINAHQAVAQSCPNVETYGFQPSSVRAANETRRVRITGMYFKTYDRSAFISEGKDLRHSASYIKVSSTDFLAKIKQLEQQNEAIVSSQLFGNMFLGDSAELNLQHNAYNASINIGDLTAATFDQDRWVDLDRQTEVSVREARNVSDAHYRVVLLSSLINVEQNRVEKTVDLDAGIFLAPGETAVFKLVGASEVARSGEGRTYFALSVSPADNNNQ